MKTNTRNLKATNNWMTATLKVVAFCLGLIGFFIAVGGVGSCQLDLISIKDNLVISTLGLLMLASGGHLYNRLESYGEEIEQDDTSEYHKLPSNFELIAWNQSQLSYMVITKLRKLDDWDFVLVSPSGEPTSRVMSSTEDFFSYHWDRY